MGLERKKKEPGEGKEEGETLKINYCVMSYFQKLPGNVWHQRQLASSVAKKHVTCTQFTSWQSSRGQGYIYVSNLLFPLAPLFFSCWGQYISSQRVKQAWESWQHGFYSIMAFKQANLISTTTKCYFYYPLHCISLHPYTAVIDALYIICFVGHKGTFCYL